MTKEIKDPELAIEFLRERQIAWFCNSIEVLAQCQAQSIGFGKKAKTIRDIARTIVSFYGKDMDRRQLNMYTRCVYLAGELVRDPHAKKSGNALQARLPALIEDMSKLAKRLRQPIPD